ncbi:organic hydroperoxide resistance protein [Pelagibacterium flavum]|uniref:Organic hydroperoxide resistance protein n=1 Tax=Pelagibacterium flavum TaxID=2984530 RepID=A0ABY6IP39_9HYPH|nr:organic hydroperoxide resistance protein [Pelagibacterium sp. YIM 151497]MAN76735.1 osmotically inducible protein OsmC [Hyphomicrobiales bacterium]UYQ72251.1 organic hydroperoxide resistance protein [Pelagibacterium sp. YIM 151497]|tara:strand:- start:1148 stop:1576 length:429 start_codon:yes stop_codon:yes gene_type:complete
MEILYTAHATASGGGREDGHSKTDDGKLDVKLSTPREMGGSGGDGTNPEQLFATGYSACFLGAMRAAARKTKLELPKEATVSADVGFGKRDDGEGFGLKVILTASAPGIDTETLKDVMDRAHIICPYSHATRGNIEVELRQA